MTKLGAPRWRAVLLACASFAGLAGLARIWRDHLPGRGGKLQLPTWSRRLDETGDREADSTAVDTAGGAASGPTWASCQSSCPWKKIAFTSNSTKAQQVHKGCERTIMKKFQPYIEHDKPALIIIGVQKGGTTSIRLMGDRLPFLCFSSDVEPHFWDQWDRQWKAPSAHILKYDYFEKQWKKRCTPEQDKIEKTPDMFSSAWAPQRMCESLGRQKLAVFLRNPVDRAFSGFLQTFPRVGDHKPGPEFFDLYARIEIALVKKCDALPTGDLGSDRKMGRTFAACCAGVAKTFRSELTEPWPACSCPRKGKYCTMFGDRTANAVRKGIYVSWLKLWYKYHRPEDILIIRAEDFFARPIRAESELACFIRPRRGCDKAHNAVVHANSATGKNAMWNKTRNMLAKFYAPYNEELDELLGRPMNWGLTGLTTD